MYSFEMVACTDSTAVFFTSPVALTKMIYYSVTITAAPPSVDLCANTVLESEICSES